MSNTKDNTLWFVVLVAILCVGLAYCNPAPAQSLRDPFGTTPVPARDPFYTTYPFQTPAQASRQLDYDRQQRRNTEAITDAIGEAQRRSDAAADARDFQRRLDQIR